MLKLPISLPDPCRNVAPAIAPPTVRQDCDQLQANESRLPLRVNARPPITPHPPTPLGFAWLWFIEQRKREREKKRSEKRDRARARKPDSKGFVFAGKTSLSSAILTAGCQATTNSAGIVLKRSINCRTVVRI